MGPPIFWNMWAKWTKYSRFHHPQERQGSSLSGHWKRTLQAPWLLFPSKDGAASGFSFHPLSETCMGSGTCC
uniref:Alternative protein TEP1 n=1 Tax=Homo sapiens TaxID=9606 RepID=L8E7X6_HUMAN|nr:alternative protein TEP1 [Homo sapiens]